MELYAKIGTGPQKKIRVGWKRNMPQVDDIIKFKMIPVGHGEKWKRGRVSMIRNLGYQLYYISL